MRSDGRSGDNTLRPLSCELSCLHRADGSALWKSGSTHVMAAVYGPIAPQHMSREQASGAIVSVLIKSGKNTNSSNSGSNTGTSQGATSLLVEQEWIALLTNVLSSAIDTSQHPRTVIEIVLQIIQDDGSVLGCLCHAAVAALMDAGVELLYLPVATTCLVMTMTENSTNGKHMLDPTLAEEEQENAAQIVLVTDPNSNQKGQKQQDSQILACHTIGSNTASIEQLLSCIPLAARASPAVTAFWRLAVEQKVTRESQTLWSK